MKKYSFSTKEITRIGILSAISAILIMINFPIPFFPNIYKIDFSAIPCLLCGFALGPIPGLTCVALSSLLNILLEGGSTTFYIGEITNFLILSSFILTSSFMYKKKHTKEGAVQSLIVSVIVSSLVSIIVNYYFSLPRYETLMNISIDDILLLVPKYFTFIKNKLSFVLFCSFPFNIIKCVCNSIITVLLYKRISPLIKDIS